MQIKNLVNPVVAASVAGAFVGSEIYCHRGDITTGLADLRGRIAKLLPKRKEGQ